MSFQPSWLSDDPTPNNASTSPNSDGVEMPQWAKDDNDVEGQQEIVVTVPESATNGSGNQTTPKTNDNSLTIGSAATAAANKSWGDYFMDSFRKDGRLLLITLLLIVVMNIPFIQWVLYPFTIFSTWIHELCHGLAAELSGGKIHKLEIFPDASGLATTSVPANRRGFVVSAGYQGTAVVGFLLLIFRRTKRGPRSGTMALGLLMILSVLIWVRNAFGVVFILLFGTILVALAWFLPSVHIRNLYVLLAATCSLNAITSVQSLFGSSHMVNGQSVSTDAHTMAELKGGGYLGWSSLWLILGLFFSLAGFMFAVPGPDEVADFTCCGICQDLGLFSCCNFPGQRLFSRSRSSSTNNES